MRAGWLQPPADLFEQLYTTIPWRAERRQMYDRVLDVPEEGIRREGAILEREKFEIIAARLRATYSWR